ncbi:MAG: PH domain-containing protein [Candidatus Berkelbacteria bacterium]|nr:PH domain-containing protein [Candidatus Berkelbacteria bacterium]
MSEKTPIRPSEQDIRVFRQSRSRLYTDLLFVVFAFLGIGILFSLSTLVQPYIWFVILILVVLTALVGFGAFLNWYSTVYKITTIRIEYKSGIISKVEEEICLEDIQTVDAIQNFIGRFLGHGDIKVEAAGQNIIILKNVRHAHKIAHEITNLSIKYNKNSKPVNQEDTTPFMQV